ncbi:MAG: hypothetical protein QOD36_1316 [Mycobacterium sp.]|jgi:hypothetical protein|nr:hypothetical protein [Mycobacterium sp.]MDT5333213.1 hypothetical protein [Mycobacterium sp.]
MTTHDEQTRATANSSADEAPAPRHESSEGMEPSTPRTDPSADTSPTEGEPLTTGDEPSAARTEPPQTENEPSSEPSTERSLLADNDLSGLRSRWDDVQAAFVDNPKECVQKADTLVAEVVEQLTTGFSDARSRLEAQWARGESASTEDLRVALKRYRDFFQRLLSV